MDRAKLFLLPFFLLWPTLSKAFEPISFRPNVVDESDSLSDQEIQSLNQDIQRLQAEADIKAAVYLIKSLDGVSIEEAAEKTFRVWQLGDKKKDNGLLLMFAMNDRRSRMEVGYGLEGTLTDLQTRRILDQVVMPKFKKKEYAEGIRAGMAMAALVHTKNEMLSPVPETLVLDSQAIGLDFHLGLRYWLGWILFLALCSLIRLAYQGAHKKTSFFKGIGIWIFLAINPGIFIALIPSFAGQLGITEFSMSNGLSLSSEIYIKWAVWAAIILLMPTTIKLFSYRVGIQRQNKHPNLQLQGYERFFYLLDLENPAKAIFKLIFIVLGFISWASIPNWDEWMGWSIGLAALQLAVMIPKTILPLISNRYYENALAQEKLRRKSVRSFGASNTGSGYSSSSSSSGSSSSGSSSSSSSGGGSSGGGGSSSSW